MIWTHTLILWRQISCILPFYKKNATVLLWTEKNVMIVAWSLQTKTLDGGVWSNGVLISSNGAKSSSSAVEPGEHQMGLVPAPVDAGFSAQRPQGLYLAPRALCGCRGPCLAKSPVCKFVHFIVPCLTQTILSLRGPGWARRGRCHMLTWKARIVLLV